jgi:hypothetical protein
MVAGSVLCSHTLGRRFPRLLSTAVKRWTSCKGSLRVSTAPSREVAKPVEGLEEAGVGDLVALTGIQAVLKLQEPIVLWAFNGQSDWQNYR